MYLCVFVYVYLRITFANIIAKIEQIKILRIEYSTSNMKKIFYAVCTKWNKFSRFLYRQNHSCVLVSSTSF